MINITLVQEGIPYFKAILFNVKISSVMHEEKCNVESIYLEHLQQQGICAEITSRDSAILRRADIKYETGMPDIVCDINGHIEFVEVKSDSDGLRDSQIKFMLKYAGKFPFTLAYLHLENKKRKTSTYEMRTRQRVLDYLKTLNEPVFQKRLQYLGMKSKQVNLDVLKKILSDLQSHSFITITEARSQRGRNPLFIEITEKGLSFEENSSEVRITPRPKPLQKNILTLDDFEPLKKPLAEMTRTEKRRIQSDSVQTRGICTEATL